MTLDTAGPDLVVLEPAPRGHGREWLLHLAEHARRCRPVPRLAFVVAPTVAESLSNELAGDPVPGLAVVPLSDREMALCTHHRLAVSGFARWWTMRRHLQSTGARQGLFLEFDHLTLPLALGMPFGQDRKVAGILFRPSVHYTDAAGSLSERLRDLRKDLLYRLTLRHGAVRHVHTLDPDFPAYARRRYGEEAPVSALPDPAHPPLDPTDADRQLAGRVPPGRRLFVLFGVLSERKGVLALLRSLEQLDRQTADQIAVLVGGEVEPAIAAEVDALAERVKHRHPLLWLHIERRFLRSCEISALIDRAHVVLAPYQRFVGSSGVLLWAASRGRPVLAQDYGLVGQLVREHRLGVTADTTDPASLARAISAAAVEDQSKLADSRRQAAFVHSRTPEAFAAAVLAPISEEIARRRSAAGRLSSLRPRDVPVATDAAGGATATTD